MAITTLLSLNLLTSPLNNIIKFPNCISTVLAIIVSCKMYFRIYVILNVNFNPFVLIKAGNYLR